MKLMFDTVNISDISKDMEVYPIVGVTSNPSIIKQEGKIDFFSHLNEIRKVIGAERSLHVQVVRTDYEGILKEADVIREKIDPKVFIKVPVTKDGLRAISALKKQGCGVTATAIYTKLQGLLAIEAGADFIAPYCNRMENMDISFEDEISYFRKLIDSEGSGTQILAASFKNIAQVHKAALAGAHTATVQPALLNSAMGMAEINKAISNFNSDFESCMGVKSILDL